MSGHDVLLDVEDSSQHQEDHIHRDRQEQEACRPCDQGRGKNIELDRKTTIPAILYRLSSLQSSVKGATISTLKEVNKVLELAPNGMGLKLRLRTAH